MKPFEEQDRYNYDLTPDSLVIDLGGFEGNFAKIISEKYGCHVVCYEPVFEFYRGIVARIASGEISHERVIPVHAAVGRAFGHAAFGVKGDQSGAWCSSPNYTERVVVCNAHDVVSGWTREFGREVDLLKLNIEGMEYDVLSALIAGCYLPHIRHVQVQFHRVGDGWQQHHEDIVRRLTETHEHMYSEPFCWDGFSLRS